MNPEPTASSEVAPRPWISKGTSIGLYETLDEHKARCELLFAVAEGTEDEEVKFRAYIMAAYFACASAEAVLEALVETKHERKTVEAALEASCHFLPFVQSIRAKDFHQGTVKFVKNGFSFMGKLTARTNPGKNNQVVVALGSNGFVQASNPGEGTLKSTDRGHEVLMFTGLNVVVQGKPKPLQSLVRDCMAGVEKWTKSSIDVR